MAHSIRSFKQLRDEVLAWLDESGSTGTILTNVNNALNEAHRRRLTSEKWPFMLWVQPETLTMVSGQQTYALHHEFHTPFYFFNRTKRCYVREVSARQLAPSGVRWNTDQDNQRFAFWGRSPVANQPSSASVLSITSSSAADNTTAKAVVVRGVTASGTEEETITPTGTSAALSTKSFITILSVTKSAAWTGTLTMTSNGGAVTNLTLLPAEFARSYQLIYLLGSPSASDIIEYRFYRLPKELEDDNDLTDFPPGHEQILVWDALLAVAAYDDRYNPARVKEWKERQNEAIKALRDATLEVQPVAADAQYVVDSDGDDSLTHPQVWIP